MTGRPATPGSVSDSPKQSTKIQKNKSKNKKKLLASSQIIHSNIPVLTKKKICLSLLKSPPRSPKVWIAVPKSAKLPIDHFDG
jgi:hypothetical protein